MKRILLAAALCALVLSGCETLCKLCAMPTNDKPVVTVTNGQIAVSPDPIVFEKSRGAVVITWKLDAPEGWRFANPARGGIRINDNKGQFEAFEVLGGGKHFQVRNKNTVPGRYKYTITLIGPDDKERAHDPVIINME